MLSLGAISPPPGQGALRVCGTCAIGAGPLELGTEDEPTWGILTSSGQAVSRLLRVVAVVTF